MRIFAIDAARAATITHSVWAVFLGGDRSVTSAFSVEMLILSSDDGGLGFGHDGYRDERFQQVEYRIGHGSFQRVWRLVGKTLFDFAY